VDQYVRTGPINLYPLHDSQHAYQRTKSCETALHYLASRIETPIGRKIYIFGALMDIGGAFDNTSFRAMNLACQKKRVHRTPTKWIDAMLSHRIASAEIRGIHSKRIVRKGCPQGDVLSPLLWNMVVDQLLRRLTKHNYDDIDK
jgi:Reverse transcriptase (RNA-dependent DNA polymerase)